MHNRTVEMKGKCRRLFYAKVDILNDDGTVGLPAGRTWVASGGGAVEELTGDDLVIATCNDPTAPDRIGCVEQYYNPIPAPGKLLKPLSIDLSKVEACRDAVTAHRAADQEKADFILECSIECGAECTRETDLRHVLKVAEIRTRSDSARHDDILAKQVELDACCAKCDTCCDTLLTTRDAAVTYAAAVVE